MTKAKEPETVQTFPKNTEAERLAIQLLAYWSNGEDPVKSIQGVQDLYPKTQMDEYEEDLRVAQKYAGKFRELSEQLVDIVAEVLTTRGIVS